MFSFNFCFYLFIQKILIYFLFFFTSSEMIQNNSAVPDETWAQTMWTELVLPSTSTSTSTTTPTVAQNLWKPFKPFPLFSLTSRQFRDGFLNDPLIIGSGVSFSSPVCWLSRFLSPLSPLYSVFKRAFSASPPHLPLLPSEWLFDPFVCAHRVECSKVPESIFPPSFFIFLFIYLESHWV